VSIAQIEVMQYGFHNEAAVLADKTIALLASDLKVNGALSHKGFMDWNLLVREMI
jgi:putative isomerase